MLQISKIVDALLPLVGWEQGYGDEYLTGSITESESGRTFQEAHPLCTLANARAVMPDNFNTQYKAWDINSAYQKGAKVMYGNVVWIASEDNVAEEPPKDLWSGDYSVEFAGSWQSFNPLTDYLEKTMRNGIKQAITNFVTTKQIRNETRDLLERRTFFDGAGRLAATETNRHRIVGFEFVPVRAMGVTMKIEKIGLQFAGGTGVVKMYLFHSSQIEPLKTFDLEYTKNGGFQWFALTDCFLPYVSDNTNSGGAYYLCYNQDELPEGMKGVNVSKDWSREPCGTCNIGSVETWRQLTKYLQVSPFATKAPTTFAQFPEMFDVGKIVYHNTCNYGLNCEVTIGCDLTDFIISQRSVFAEVVQKQTAYILLRTMAMNPDTRVNRNQSNVSRLDILYELDGNTDSKHPQGLGAELQKAYKAIEIDTQGLDRICLSCNNGGVKYRTV